MTDQLERAFGEIADTAHQPTALLDAVHHRVAVRRTWRRRIAVGGSVAAVAAIATTVVLLSNTVHPTVVADVHPAASITLTIETDAACSSGNFAPGPTSLTTADVPKEQNIGLGLVPQGWVVRMSTDSDIVYSDPTDHSSSQLFIGKIAASISTAPELDFQPTTTIGGHPATVTFDGPCSTGYPGTWNVNLQFSDNILVQVEGPMSMALSDAQIADIAASVVVRKLTPGLG